VQECVGTAVREQPWLSLGGALACFSTAMGRRYMGPTGVRPNLYVLGVAPSVVGQGPSAEVGARTAAQGGLRTISSAAP
jgi:hypothetical protein